MVWACPNASSRGAELRLIVTALGAALLLSACATTPSQLASTRTTTGGPQGAAEGANPANGARYKLGAPYQAGGLWYVPAEQPAYDEVGIASWYGDDFNGQATADGERFDMYSASAAHTTLPLPSIIEVTNLENGRTIRVRLNDRGPFKSGRIIDLSRGAAQSLGYLNQGTAKVRVRYVGPAKLDGSLEPLFVAQGSSKPLQLAAAAPVDIPPEARAVWRAPAAASSGAPAVPAAAPRAASPLQLASATPATIPAATRAVWHAPDATVAYTRPTPPALTSWTPKTPDAPDGFAVQAGAFSDRTKAQHIADTLSKAGTAAVRPVDAAQGRLYRVVLGPWRDADQAAAARAQVVALGFSDARVVKAF